jgi:hypothetical protein
MGTSLPPDLFGQRADQTPRQFVISGTPAPDPVTFDNRADNRQAVGVVPNYGQPLWPGEREATIEVADGRFAV